MSHRHPKYTKKNKKRWKPGNPWSKFCKLRHSQDSRDSSLLTAFSTCHAACKCCSPCAIRGARVEPKSSWTFGAFVPVLSLQDLQTVQAKVDNNFGDLVTWGNQSEHFRRSVRCKKLCWLSECTSLQHATTVSSTAWASFQLQSKSVCTCKASILFVHCNSYLQSADPGRRAQSSYSYVESKICF